MASRCLGSQCHCFIRKKQSRFCSSAGGVKLWSSLCCISTTSTYYSYNRSCACRDREDAADRRKAVDLYKVLQRIMQQEHGFDNDQNAMVLRVLSDTLESLQQYGEPLCRCIG